MKRWQRFYGQGMDKRQARRARRRAGSRLVWQRDVRREYWPGENRPRTYVSEPEETS